MNDIHQSQGNSLSQLNLGKINLLKNYLKIKLPETGISTQMIIALKYYKDYSRYEFLFVSKALNLIIVANRAGDVQIYKMEINLYSDGKVGIDNEPIFVIDCNSRITGLRVIDHFDEFDHGKSFCEIFILKLNRTFLKYKITNHIFN